MSDRERLLKILTARAEQRNCPTMEQMADALLAAGIKLPPAPEQLVTEAMANEHAKTRTTIYPPLSRSGKTETKYEYEFDALNALCAAAIRRAVERHRDANGQVPVRLFGGATSFAMAHSILALFGLEAP